MKKKNPGDLTAKQQQRRIASTARRKRRAEKFTQAVTHKLRKFGTLINDLQTKVIEAEQARDRALAGKEEPTNEEA